MSVSEYVREALWRVRSEEAWARALAQAWTEPQGADRRD
jgi:Arc/MetJ-type ribon-helix-helix transcriptional regulator